ncbi:hypothetical protein [Pandoraea apista]|uniref:Uncharacterized protein n=1 Tax=Pandoraea apista TaxID=93218 RepID=A0A5E5PCM9_9BURK|nr:hypothetical protein [Pandoraea apista]PTE00881.1 hypothetical protein C7830_11645 [Pandoraea apista]RRJ30843.1 hypothetical protein EIB05_13775 [Pandoraea apista]RRJ74530.1 hypothetical protein EIL82_14830 [Pandoraea apista]RSD06704.1 hypothetical protein EJB12_20395 [Pandoraea apista]RSD14587.1 hypothetical protein EIZ52_18320 [Pandoraea apista]
MKFVLFVSGMSLVLANASAEPVFRVKDGGSVACTTSEAVYQSTRHPDAPLPDNCARLQPGTAFEAMNRSLTYVPKDQNEPILGIIAGRPLAAPNEREQPTYFRVNSDTVEAVRDAKGDYVQPSCDYPESYVTSKLLNAPDGKLYLKQGKVTIKCVNGEMRQIYQPLN